MTTGLLFFLVSSPGFIKIFCPKETVIMVGLANVSCWTNPEVKAGVDDSRVRGYKVEYGNG